MLTDDKTLIKLAKKAFPKWNGRAIKVETAEQVYLGNRYWSGGYYSEYTFVDVKNGRIAEVPERVDFPFSAKDPTVKIPDGTVCFKFQYAGTRKYLTAYVHPQNLVQQIEAAPDLSDDERVVLYFTRAYKSSYGGIKNYRYSEARQATGVSSENWDAAKASLVDKGLMNARGALTIAGKNAADQLTLEYSTRKVVVSH